MPVIRASVCKFAASKICLKVHLLPLVNRGGAERFSHASNLEKTLSKSKEILSKIPALLFVRTSLSSTSTQTSYSDSLFLFPSVLVPHDENNGFLEIFGVNVQKSAQQ